MPLNEIEDAIALVHDEADENANIIFGTVYNETDEDEVKITVIATGFDHAVRGVELPSPVKKEVRAVGQTFTPPQGMKPGEEPKKEDLDVPTFIRRQAD